MTVSLPLPSGLLDALLTAAGNRSETATATDANAAPAALDGTAEFRFTDLVAKLLGKSSDPEEDAAEPAGSRRGAPADPALAALAAAAALLPAAMGPGCPAETSAPSGLAGTPTPGETPSNAATAAEGVPAPAPGLSADTPALSASSAPPAPGDAPAADAVLAAQAFAPKPPTEPTTAVPDTSEISPAARRTAKKENAAGLWRFLPRAEVAPKLSQVPQAQAGVSAPAPVAAAPPCAPAPGPENAPAGADAPTIPQGAGDPAVTALPADAPVRLPLAFQARLTAEERIQRPAGNALAERPAIESPVPAPASARDAETAADHDPPAPSAAPGHAAAPARPPDEDASHPSAELSVQLAGASLRPALDGWPPPEARGPDAVRPERAAEPQPIRPEAEIRTEPVRHAEPARDIRLQINAGEQRVEIRLSDRGGDIQVAVRTPDSRLAGDLRDNLPALTVRLEQTGFRAETWHPEASILQHRWRTVETAAATASDNGQQAAWQGPRDRGQDSRREPRPAPQQAPARQRKDFEWLLLSLR